MAVEVQQVVHAGVLVTVVLLPVQLVHQKVEHMVHMLHIHVQMNVINKAAECVNVRVHVHLQVVQAEQQKQIQEIIILPLVAQTLVVKVQVGIATVLFVLHRHVLALGIMILI